MNISSKDVGFVQKRRCFVCNKLVDTGTSLNSLIPTTKIHVHQKLTKLVAGKVGINIKEECLCSLCIRLLGYMNQIEEELAMINKAILKCMRGKHILQQNVCNKQDGSSSRDDLNKKEDGKSEAITYSWSDEEVNDTNAAELPIDSSERSGPQASLPPKKQFQCKICNYKTEHKSVIIFHLRQHVTNVMRCDFCNLPVVLNMTSGVNDDNSLKTLMKENDIESCIVKGRSVNADESEIEVKNLSDGNYGIKISMDGNDINSNRGTKIPVNTTNDEIRHKHTFIPTSKVQTLKEDGTSIKITKIDGNDHYNPPDKLHIVGQKKFEYQNIQTKQCYETPYLGNLKSVIINIQPEGEVTSEMQKHNILTIVEHNFNEGNCSLNEESQALVTNELNSSHVLETRSHEHQTVVVPENTFNEDALETMSAESTHQFATKDQIMALLEEWD